MHFLHTTIAKFCHQYVGTFSANFCGMKSCLCRIKWNAIECSGCRILFNDATVQHNGV